MGQSARDGRATRGCPCDSKSIGPAIKEANDAGIPVFTADIEIVAKLPGGGARDRSFKTMQDILQAHPDITAVYAINAPSALGARAALEKAGKADQVKIVGFDGQPEGKQAIKEGKIHADPIQFPDQIGRKTVQAIVKYFEGEKLAAEILIPTALYRKADAEKNATLNLKAE